MNCLTQKISILGLCETNTEYSVLLDNYGVSLNSLSKINPKSIANGKTLLESIINDSIKETIRGVRFEGMEIGRVINQYTLGVQDCDTSLPMEAGQKGIKLLTSCDTTAFYIGQVEIFGNGETSVFIEIDGVQEEILPLTTIVGKKTIYLNRLITAKEVFILLDMDAFEPCSVDISGCDCATYLYCVSSTGTANEGYGIVASVSLRCDLTNWYCQFGDLIADVAKYKVLARIFHTLAYSDRLNDYVLFKDSDKLFELMSFYDSTFNIPALSGEVKAVPRGQYQIALDELKIPKPSCTCCDMICAEQFQFKLTNL